jgi:replicative DNA helicase
MILKMGYLEENKILFCSLEMSSAQLFQRMLKVEMKLERIPSKFCFPLDPEEFKYKKVSDLMGKLPIWVNDEHEIDVDKLIENIKEQRLINSINIVLVDYIQLLIGGTCQKVFDSVLCRLSEYAKLENIVIVITSQLGRDVDQTEDKIPTIDSINSLGAFSKYAAGIGFLYRPEYYGFLKDGEGVSTAGKASLFYHECNTVREIPLTFNSNTGKYY